MTLEAVPWRGHTVPLLDAESVSRASFFSNWTGLFNRAWQDGQVTQSVTPVQTTYGTRPAEPIGTSFTGYVEGMLYRDGPVAAAEAYRLRVFGQAPVLFQERTNGRPGDLYDHESLDLLRAPWAGGTAGDLMKRALLYSDFGGNAYIVEIAGELVVLRPDWVEIILSARMYEGYQVGFRQEGICYYEGGLGAASARPATFLRGEYIHFISYMPDPLATYRGMSWLTPIIRDIQGDIQATTHAEAFLRNSATPNLAVSLPKEVTPQQFNDFVELMDSKHKGVSNAGKTLYTGGGADVTVVGANMQQMDFTGVQGKIETRIANASGVPATLLGFSEGMQGSSLNAGNYTAAKRNFVDTTMRDLWSNWCGSAQTLFPPPTPGDRLAVDPRDIPFLHEDQKDAAEIQQIKAATINTLITAGYEPDSVTASVDADDRKLLKHTGLTSVQLVPPGQDTTPPAAGEKPGAESETQARALLALAGTLEEVVRRLGPSASEEDGDAEALLAALDEASGVTRAWSPEQKAKHPRNPAGSPGGGRFRSTVSRLVEALANYRDNGGVGRHPFHDFDREPLRRTAKARGIPVPHGATKREIADALLADLGAAPSAGALSNDPAVREVQIDNRIRDAYIAVLARQGKTPQPGNTQWVGLADLRDELGESTNRHEVDAALRRMGRGDYDGPGGPVLVGEPNQKTLTPTDREAAVHFGDQAHHAITFDDPSPRPLPGAAKPDAPDDLLSTDPAVREVQIDNRVRAAYVAVLAKRGRTPRPGDSQWVGLADLRAELGDLSREEVDAALFRLSVSRGPGDANVVPESNQKALTDRDRDAAVVIGDQPNHAIRFEDPSPQPLPAEGPAATSTEDVRDALDLRKVPELKAMLREAGLPVSGRKRDLVDRLVEHRASADRTALETTAGTGRDLSRDDEAMAAIWDAAIDENGVWIESSEGDLALIGVARAQGFDAKPTVLGGDDFDRAVAEGGHAVMYRGINPKSFWGEGKWRQQTTGADVHAQLREGDYRPGYGIFGNGFYFATDRAKAESFSDGEPGSLGRYALAKDARVVDYTSLLDEYGEWFDTDLNEAPEATQGVTTDFGRYAASRGYDAIRVPVGTRMLGGGAVQREEWVVLNRGALIADRDVS